MRADLLSLVEALVRDEVSRLSAADIGVAFDLALHRYSKDRPRRLVADVLGDGSDVLPLPLGWENESELVGVEYPVGLFPAAITSALVYTAPAGRVLRVGAAVAAGASVRCTFTVRHVVDDATDTVPLRHREGVSAYAAALLLEELAAAAINDGDATIHADTTDRRTKAQEYASRARSLKARYVEVLELSRIGDPQVASGASIAWGSRPRLTQGIRRG